MRHIFLTSLIVLCVEFTGFAQHNGTKDKNIGNRSSGLSRFGVSLKGGLTQFYGELNEQDMKGSYGLGVDGRIWKGIHIGIDYSAGKVGGQKNNFFNSYFVTEYNAVEITGKWNLTQQFSKRKDDIFDLSVYTGIGVILFNANAFDLQTNQLVRFSNSESSKRNQLFLRWGNPRGRAGIRKTQERIIPVGAMVDYNLSKRWKLGMDFRLYLVRTDKLDATSGQRLINPEEGESYSDTPNDKFSLLSVTVTRCFLNH